MSVTNLHNLPEKAWDRIVFYLTENDQRRLLVTSKTIFRHISCALWKIAIYQRPIAAKMWSQMEDSISVETRIVCLFRRFEFAAFLKQKGNRSSQSQSDSRSGCEPWLEDFWAVKPGEFQRAYPLSLRQGLDRYQQRLNDVDLFRAAVRKGDLEWAKSFDLNEMEIKKVDEMALLSLSDLSGNSLFFGCLLPYTSVYRGESEKESRDLLTRLIIRSAIKECSAEFQSLIHLNKPFSYGEVLTVLARKNLVPEIRMLLSLEEVQINEQYIMTHESQLGVLSSNGLHAAILEASLAASIEAVREILAHFPNSIPYNILRHARDLLRAKGDAKFGKEVHPIYEKGYNRLYKYLYMPDQWKRTCTIPDHRRICQFLCKEIVRRFPDPTPFQNECLLSRGFPLEEKTLNMVIKFEPFKQ